LRAFLSLLSAVSPEGAAFEHERKELEKIILMVEERREFSLHDSVDLITGYIINRTLRGSDGCQDDAARMLGMSERSLRRQIRNGSEW
jgi:transcriptional regulator with GAF, ATPase, and Fis domain